MSTGALEQVRPVFRRLAAEAGLLDTGVTVSVKPLTPEEAIGSPTRRDFPILIGKERVIESSVVESRGHAFTDTARNFAGRLGDVIDLPLDQNGDRAIYLAVLNATLKHLGRLRATLHCKDDDPEKCGTEMVQHLKTRFGAPEIGLIGFNPAIAEHLVTAFGADHVWITDLNPDNIGQQKHQVTIEDGATATEALIAASDVVLLTGTTLVNGTFDAIWKQLTGQEKHGIVFGVTAAGVCSILGYDWLCPFAREA